MTEEQTLKDIVETFREEAAKQEVYFTYSEACNYLAYLHIRDMDQFPFHLFKEQ